MSTAGSRPITGLLVGAYFRPPAQHVLAVLPSQTPLELRPEPENPYDPEAIAVYLAGVTLKELLDKSSPGGAMMAKLEDTLPSCGWSLELLLVQEEIQLGYLARAGNKALVKVPGLVSAAQFRTIKSGLLVWGPNGEPTVQVQEPTP